jgi:hypothetical protein
MHEDPSSELDKALEKWYRYMKRLGDSDRDLYEALLEKIKKITNQ